MAKVKKLEIDINWTTTLANVATTVMVWAMCKYVFSQPASPAELSIVYLLLNNCKKVLK